MAATCSTACSLEAKGQEIFDEMLAVASGEKTKSEAARLWRQRVRALADRRDVLGPPAVIEASRNRHGLDVEHG